jgi:hypothetical protein
MRERPRREAGWRREAKRKAREVGREVGLVRVVRGS